MNTKTEDFIQVIQSHSDSQPSPLSAGWGLSNLTDPEYLAHQQARNVIARARMDACPVADKDIT